MQNTGRNSAWAYTSGEVPKAEGSPFPPARYNNRVPKKKDVYYRPYKRELVPFAKGHRRDPTPAERKLWYDFLHNLKPYFYWQREIGSFITDFYCAEAKLVIEVDGDSHFTEQGVAYDAERTAYLESVGLRVIRFTNAEVLESFEGVCTEIRRELGRDRPLRQR